MIIRYAVTAGAIGGYVGCFLKGLRKGVWGITMFLVIFGPALGLRLPYVTKKTRHGLSRMRVMIWKKKKNMLKDALKNAPALATINYIEGAVEIILTVDASGEAWGAILHKLMMD